MNKIGLIIRREYLTRIRNKTFLISTFLLPVLIVMVIAGTVFLAIKGKDQSPDRGIRSEWIFQRLSEK